MPAKKPKLELTWIGKENRPRLEPRILLEDPSLSYHAPKRVTENDIFDNMLIQGDNLLALKALEQEFAGKVKCIYIDPPYNTGAAFSHYQDGLEHSAWLSLMRDRPLCLRDLLCTEGVLLVSIDDSQSAYLRLLLDEIFGRDNFCGAFVWEKKKKPSFLHSSMGTVTEPILTYAKSRMDAPSFTYGRTTEGKKYPLNNAGNSLAELRFPAGCVEFACPDQDFAPQDMSEGNIITRLIDKLRVRGGRNVEQFRLEGEWRYSQPTLDELLARGERIVISKPPFRPNHVKRGGEPKKVKNLLSRETYGIPTYEDATEESRRLFGAANAFDYPKPEGLLEFLLVCCTNPGDLVLDSFVGSGTTAAVAQKTGRRWIAVELGEHAASHVVPRMRKVIDGDDPGGVTDRTLWGGGGGFRFYTLAPSLLQRDPWGNWVVSKEYRPEMLAEAVCKLEGFRYDPDPEDFWIHGRSTERDFLYVTTQNLSRDQLRYLSDQVGAERTLLICCSAFRAKRDEFRNLTLKKIPQAVMGRCEWGRDDYSLNVAALPGPDPEEAAEEAEPATKGEGGARPKTRGKATAQGAPKVTPKGTPKGTAKKGKRGAAVQELPLFDAGPDERGGRR